MQNKIGYTGSNRNLLEFLFGTDENASVTTDAHTDVADSTDKKIKVGAIKDKASTELLQHELDELYNQFFARAKICHSLAQLLKEIETPDEDTDVTKLKELVYSELRWLQWDEKKMLAATYEDEVKWLKQLVVKTIGSNNKTRNPTQKVASR